MTEPDYVRLLTAIRPSGWNVATIDPETRKIQGAFIETVPRLKEWVAENDGKLNCYFQANYAPDVGPESKYRASAEQVRDPQWLYADVDPYKTGDGTLEDRKVEALERCRKAMPHAFAIVDTGGGYQPLCKLSAPTTQGVSDALNYGLLEDLGGDKGTYTVERLLRLPGTLNIPTEAKIALGRVPVMAKLVELHPERTVEEFEFRIGRPPTKTTREFGDPIVPDDFSTFADQYNLSESLRELIVTGDADRKIGDGSRSDRVFYVAAELVRHGCPDDMILGILTDSEWGISESLIEKGDYEALRAAERAVRHAYDHGAGKSKAVDDFADDLDVELKSPEEVPGNTPARIGRFERLKPSYLRALPIPKWLVKDWLTEFGLTQVIGVRKRGKTFVVLDLALCIAMGLEWRGHPVMRKRVTYIISEGSMARFYDRIHAWCIEYKVDPEDLEDWFDIIDGRVSLDKPADVKAFYEADTRPVGLIIVDTVARNMDGDENSTLDMNHFVEGADRLRRLYKCAMMVVHHIGKDEGRGGRGSTSLPGAVDATIRVTKRVTKEGVKFTALMEEMRDGEEGQKLSWDVVLHEVDGEDMRQGVTIRPTEAVEPGDEGDEDNDATGEAVLVAIAERGGIQSGQALVEKGKRGFSKANVYKVIKRLVDAGLLMGTSPITVTPEGENKAMELGATIPLKE